MKKLAVYFAAILLSLLSITVVYANPDDPVDYMVPYSFTINSNYSGYNTAPKYKYDNEPIAMVCETDAPIGYKTNYIIIASDSTQITPNYIITHSGIYDYVELYYYSAHHVGWVMMRANSGGTGINYTVSGWWMPNFRP